MKTNLWNKISSKISKKVLVVMLAALCLLSLAGGAYAYLMSKSPEVNNEYEMGSVTCVVNAEQNTITNTGNVPARVRAALVVNWYDESGALTYVPSTDYQMTLNLEGWTASGGYYYYDGIVQPEASITAPSANVSNLDGLHCRVTVLADAIQAAPAAAEDAWGYSFPD